MPPRPSSETSAAAPATGSAAGRAQGSTSTTPESILAAAREALPWMVEIRRDLHRHPELGLEEHRTAARVAAILDELGIEHVDGLAGTGVLGTLRSEGAGKGGRVVALRADLDALPLDDAKEEAPYRSQVPGRMHACGHDVHTTILLGAARLLASRRRDFAGTVKLIFQPAEETVGGALPLIEAGVLDDPPVDAIFGLHVEPGLEVGAIGLHYGQRNASSDDLSITIHGRSCHGAYPAAGVDAIVAAAQVLTAVQAVASRNVDAREAAVVTFGVVRGGTQANIVADRVELLGTVRALDPAVRELVLRRVRETAEGIANAFGARAEVTVEPGYAALINDGAMVDLVRRNAARLVGEERVVVLPKPNLGVEDFAYYLQRVPGAFYSLGVGNRAAGVVHPLHHPRFDVDESSMAVGAALQTLNVVAALES